MRLVTKACMTDIKFSLDKKNKKKLTVVTPIGHGSGGSIRDQSRNRGLPASPNSYLRELLADNVRREVESLPFTNEGYNRAKAILKEKYGKESEIVKAYVKEILPLIPSGNAKKIAEFSDKLTYCVQSSWHHYAGFD